MMKRVGIIAIIGCMIITAVPMTVQSEDLTSFILQGYVYLEDNSTVLQDWEVNAYNYRTNETITVFSDENGYYEVDLADSQNGWESDDNIFMSVEDYSESQTGQPKMVTAIGDPHGDPTYPVSVDFTVGGTGYTYDTIYYSGVTGTGVDNNHHNFWGGIEHPWMPVIWSVSGGPIVGINMDHYAASSPNTFVAGYTVHDNYPLDEGETVVHYIEIDFDFSGSGLISDSDHANVDYHISPGQKIDIDPLLYITLTHNNPTYTTFTMTITGNWYTCQQIGQYHYHTLQGNIFNDNPTTITKQWGGNLQNNW